MRQLHVFRTSISRQIGSGYALGLLFALIITVVSFFSIRLLNKTAYRVDHTHLVMHKLENIRASLKDAEAGHRGFLLTNQQSYLDPYREAAKTIDRTIDEVHELSSDNPIQQQRLKGLESLVEAKMAEMKQTIIVKATSGFDAALRIVETDRGKYIMDDISQILGDMMHEERRLLALREHEARTTTCNAFLIIGFSTLLAAGFLCYLGTRMAKRVSVPVEELTRKAHLIATGDFTAKAEVDSRDEFKVLADSFNTMVSHLTNLTDNLNRQKKEVESQNASLENEILFRMEVEKALLAAKKEAEVATESKSEFLANMSHEIRTPMNGVIGMTSLLLDSELTEDQLDCARTIQASAESLLTIINDILDFSKIEAGKLEMEHIEFNLWNTLENITDMLYIETDRKSLNFSCVVDRTIPEWVIGDSVRLHQVLLNLLSNAIKFTSEGEVNLYASIESRSNQRIQVLFEVSDTGIGIPDNRLNRLFKSFSQVDASTTRKFGGTGLGLTICKRLVEMMGGKIGVQSIEGRGSTFWFTCTFEYSTREDTPPGLSLEGKQVLIVEPYTTRRRAIYELLAPLGGAIYEAGSEQEALDLLNNLENPFDAAFISEPLSNPNGNALFSAFQASGKALIALGSHTYFKQNARKQGVSYNASLKTPLKRTRLYKILSETLQQEAALEKAPISLHVLLVENNLISQRIASKILATMGHTVTAVSTGQAALEVLERDAFDVVLMDIHLPDMSGVETTLRIRAMDTDFATIPIIGMTDEVATSLYLEAGMNACTPIPINADDLATRLATLRLTEGPEALAALLDDTTRRF